MTPGKIDFTLARTLTGIPVTEKRNALPTPVELDMAVTGELRAIRCWLVFLAVCAMTGVTGIGFIVWLLMRAFNALAMGGATP